MRIPFRRKIKSTHQWEYEPYSFEVGRKYVIEINRHAISIEEVKDLDKWFFEQGLNVKLVLSKTGPDERALHPITVKRLTEEIRE